MRRVMVVVLVMLVGGLLVWLIVRPGHQPVQSVRGKVTKATPQKQVAPPPTNATPVGAVMVAPHVVPPLLTREDATRKPDWKSLSPDIQLIVGQGWEKEGDVRNAAVHHLGTKLTPKEVEALYWFLDSRLDQQSDLDNLSFNAIKNDVLDALMAQNNLPADLGEKLVGYFRDTAQDITWRDYCVQHFSIYYETRWAQDNSVRMGDPARLELMKAYDEALKEPANGIAGTALVGLERLSTSYPEIDRHSLGETALQLARNPASDVQTQTAAINVCGMTGASAILPLARSNARSATVIPLRLASIAVIGQVGTPEDKAYLESLLSAPDKILHPAAQAALKALASRK